MSNSTAQTVASKHHSSAKGIRESWRTQSLEQQMYKMGKECDQNRLGSGQKNGQR